MTQGANIAARNSEYIHIEELDIRRRFSCHFFHDPERVGTLNLISERLPSSLIGGRPFVSFRRCVITASLYVVLHPIAGGRPADEIEFVLGEVKKDGITDHISSVIAGDELFRLIDFEILEAIDAKIRKDLDRIRPLDINVRHMMGLIEECTGLAPGTLLIASDGAVRFEKYWDMRYGVEHDTNEDRELADKMTKGELQLGVFQGYEFAWAQEKQPQLKPLALAVNVYRLREGAPALRATRKLFAFSILYLFALFATLLLEVVVGAVAPTVRAIISAIG